MSEYFPNVVNGFYILYRKSQKMFNNIKYTN